MGKLRGLLAAALLAVGCGSPLPPERDGFVLQIAEYPPTLDPARHYDTLSIAVVGKVFTGLLSLDPETLEPRPDVAESYELLEDGRVLRFHLRPGVRFHNGREVVAEDFRFAFERLLRLEPPAPAAWILEPLRGAAAFARGEADAIAGLTVEGPRTLRLELEAPFAPFLQHLAMPNAAAVARETLVDGALPVGTGPYRLERADPEAGSIVLRAWEGFYPQPPELERIEIRVVADPGRALERYWQGELDMLSSLPPASWTLWRHELGDELHRWPILSLFYLVAQPERVPAAELPRRALAQAIDRLSLCEEALGGRCQTAAGILPPGILGHDPHDPGLRYDPEAAAALLARAGHPDGRGLRELGLWVQERAEHEAVAYAIAEQLAHLGLRVGVRPVPWSELLEAAVTGAFDLLLIPWTADYPDPDNFLFPILHGSQCGVKNYACFRDPRFDRLLDEARRATDPHARLELYRQAERLAIEAAPIVPLYFPTEGVVVRGGWQGLVLHPMGWQQIPLERLRWRGR